MKNDDITKKILKEYPTPEKLMKYNAYNQELIMHEFEYSFMRASPEVAKLQPDRNVSQSHKNELARYQEYLNLEPDEFVVPTDDSDTSSYVDTIPAANHQNKKQNIKISHQCDKISKDDDSGYNDDSGDDDSVSLDDDTILSNQEEDSEVINEDDYNSKISKNVDKSSNFNDNIPSHNPTSFVSDIEFVSTKIHRRKAIVIDNRSFQSKFLRNIFIIFSYRYLNSNFFVAQMLLPDDHPGKESKLIIMNMKIWNHLQVKTTPILVTKYARILITKYPHLTLGIQMIM